MHKAKRSNFSPKVIAYVGVMLAIAYILSYFRVYQFPASGSVTPMSMFFVSFIGICFGPKIGLASAFAFGLLQLTNNAFIVHPIQLLLDYPLAFGALGLAGFFHNKKYGMFIGFAVGVVGRWFFSSLSGYFFFYQWAWDGWSVLPYAMAYNAIFMFTEMAASIIIVSIPPMYIALNVVKSQLFAKKAP